MNDARRRDASVWVLAAMIAVYVVVFGVLAWQRHDRYGSFGFDMGIYDQAVWLTARGGSFITVRGLDVFGHHANVAFFLLSPFSWLGAGPDFLNLLQVTALGGAAVPVWLLGRDRLRSGWLALVPAGAYLLHPSTGFLAWELFHPETMAIPFLLAAYVAADRRRWRWYLALIVVTVAWKEDLALAAVALGLLLVIRGDRRVGAWTMVLSLGWFLFVNRILLSAVNGAGAFYDQFYGDLGDSPLGIVTTALTQPGTVATRLTSVDALEYLWGLVAPLGVVLVAAPLVLLVAVPQLLANLLSIHGFTREITFHYSAVPLAVFALATAEGLAVFVGNRRALLGASALVVVASLVGAVTLGASPIGRAYDDGYWPAAADPRRASKDAAVALVPPDARVSATYQFVPHLSHRKFVYEFPNPFRERNWGVRGEGTHDPDRIEWLIVDTQTTGTEDRELIESLVGSPSWTIVFGADELVVARRTAPG
jgi:uncharacterized membrane protein